MLTGLQKNTYGRHV